MLVISFANLGVINSLKVFSSTKRAAGAGGSREGECPHEPGREVLQEGRGGGRDKGSSRAGEQNVPMSRAREVPRADKNCHGELAEPSLTSALDHGAPIANPLHEFSMERPARKQRQSGAISPIAVAGLCEPGRAALQRDVLSRCRAAGLAPARPDPRQNSLFADPTSYSAQQARPRG